MHTRLSTRTVAVFLISFLLILLPMRLSAGAAVGIKDAHRAVVRITTYDGAGRALRTGYGFFSSERGEVVTLYSLLTDAQRVVATDSKGRTAQLYRILGADGALDLARFSTTGITNAPFLSPAAAQEVVVGTTLSAVPYELGKKPRLVESVVVRADEFKGKKYYTLSLPNDSLYFGCPLVDAAGRPVALVQRNVERQATGACALDLRFAASLGITAADALSADLRALPLPKALPAGEKEALTYIYMLASADTASYAAVLSDFIAAYPAQAEGYTLRAAYHAAQRRYAESEADFTRALTAAAGDASTMRADEVHNEWSKQMYRAAISADSIQVPNWTFTRAASEAKTAYDLHSLPYYLLQEGRCHYAAGDYRKAYENFRALTALSTTSQGASESTAEENGAEGKGAATQWSDVARAEAWWLSALSHERAGGESHEVIALMDSAVTLLPHPLRASDAQYLFDRSRRLMAHAEYRRAAIDLIEYEKLIGPKNLTAAFYFLREQTELGARMFAQALDDIRAAQALAPRNADYKLEEALVMLRAGLYDECLERCKALESELGEQADLCKIAGLAHGEQGRKAEALRLLRRAKALGDDSVDAFIARYNK